MRNKTIKIAATLLLSSIVAANAQVCHNLYPCAECAVYDNGGHDLNGFITTNKKDATYKSGRVSSYSGGDWGYLQVKTVHVPSLNVHPYTNKKVDLDYSQYINATVALYNAPGGMEATWWARQCNNPEGPLYDKKVDDEVKLDATLTRYRDVFHDLQAKKFTIVENCNEPIDQLDYDVLLKNYMIIEQGIIKNEQDYKALIDFYNGFAAKFTYMEDPLLDNKSFLTFFTSGKTRYIGYFNMVNHKLAGHVMPVTIEYEKDKDPLVSTLFKKLKGKTVFVYGDDLYGMEHNILKYGHTNSIKMIRRNTDTKDKFNTANM